MTAEFNNATIKCWFNTLGTSRNFKNVTMIHESESSYLIKTSDGNQYILPIANVNILEQAEGKETETKEDAEMGKKMLELRERFKKER